MLACVHTAGCCCGGCWHLCLSIWSCCCSISHNRTGHNLTLHAHAAYKSPTCLHQGYEATDGAHCISTWG